MGCWTSDQGLEAQVADAPHIFMDEVTWGDTIERLRSGDLSGASSETCTAFLFPNSLPICDALHVLYNALEASATCLPDWVDLPPPHLMALARFSGDLGMKRRFLATCVKREDLPYIQALVNDCRIRLAVLLEVGVP